jgi:Mn-dependent DtxR family transcriptional regulator
VGDIREYLPYPHSTLNSVIKRLQKEEIVEWEAYGIVRLKHIGREMAAHQLDHHGIIHQYFLQELGLTDEEAHEESMRIAGIISCHTVIKMMEKLPEERPTDCSLILDKV